jgi:light-regulated signal transduction histidine kinase (bacteriophytochrome)
MAIEVLQVLQQDDPARTVSVQIQSGLMAYGDARLLRVVMDNLLGNAWKFTAHAQAAAIEVGEELKGGQIVYFVRDNGIGFDMAYADKLFGAFQRLHDAVEFPGTGIGLATVQRVIHKHGGQIWAESAVNQGAIFYFTLDEKESA